MASSAILELVVTLKDQASKGLGQVSHAVDDVGEKATHTQSLLNGVFTGIGFAAVNLGLSAVSGGFQELTSFIGDSIQESRDAAAGLAQTEAVIKSTGGAAGITAAQIVDMAGALSHATLFTDDAIQADENLLLTFTNLKNGVGAGNDIFTQATKVSLDLAQAMGTDAAGGAIQLGKALNDPTAGISALTRVGVTFSAEQKDMIKSLQDSGDMMGAQKIILAELNKEFGGSAAAAAKADGGYHLLQQRMADVKQTIGDALQPALRALVGLMAGPGMDAVERLGTAFAGNLTKSVQWFTATGLPGMVTALTTTAHTMTTISGVISTNLHPAVLAIGTATLVYGATQIPVLIASLTTLIPQLYAEGAALTASLGPLALLAAGIYALAKANQYYDDQARTVVEHQDRANESFQAAAKAIDAYTTSTAAQGTAADDLADQLRGLQKAHDDAATTVERWAGASDQARRAAGLTDDAYAALKTRVKELDGQIGTMANTLTNLVAADSLNAFQAQFGDDRRDSIMGYTSAVQGATTAVEQLAAVPLTGDDLKAYQKALEDTATGAQKAFSDMFTAQDKYQADSADLATKHWETIAKIDGELHGKITKDRRAELNQQRADEVSQYAQQTQDLKNALAEQVAANRSALGTMLRDRIEALKSDPTSGVDLTKANAEIADIERRYGLLPDYAGKAAADSLAIVQAGITEGSGRTTEQIGRDTDAIQQHYADLEKTSSNLRDLLKVQIETTMVGDDPVVIGQAITREWGRAQAMLAEFPDLAGQAFSSIDEFNKALAVERTLKIHTEADTGDVPERLKGIQDQTNAIDTRAPAYVRVTTDAEITKAMLEGTTASLDALDRHPVVNKQVTTDTAAATALLDATTASLDLLDRHPIVDKQITTNAPTITGFIVDTGNAYSSVGALPPVDKSITTNAPTVTGQLNDTGATYKGLSGLATPDLHITTNAAEVASLLSGVRAAMGSIPESKTIRIAAGIDPMLVRKSPAPIEQVMMAITEFEARDHVFKVSTAGNLDALASYSGAQDPLKYSGATDPLSYMAPSMREMPAWVGYVKDLGDGLTLLGPRTDWMAGAAQNAQDLGDGLRLLGDQTPAVQDLGNGLSLLGDQWARQASTMTDLAPKLPQLAAGYTGIATAATTAAAATTRATDDMLDHIKLLGGASLDGKAGFGGDSGGGPLSYLNDAGGLGGTAQYAKQAGTDAGMGFGDGWKAGIEQIGPVFQDTTRMALLQLHDVVLLPWQTQTNDFFSGAGFGFIGQASIGINSAGNGLATSAGNVGGAAGAALVSSMRGNLGGVSQFVSDVNTTLSHIEREITIHVKTVYDG